MIRSQDSVASRLNTLEVVFTLLIHALRAVSGIFSVMSRKSGFTFGLPPNARAKLTRQVSDVLAVNEAVEELQRLAENAIVSIDRARDNLSEDNEPDTEESSPETVKSSRLDNKTRIVAHCNMCGLERMVKRKKQLPGTEVIYVEGCKKCCSKSVAKDHWNNRMFVDSRGQEIFEEIQKGEVTS